MLEPCYEYLGCINKACVMFNDRSGIRCWEMAGTDCNHSAIDIVRERTAGTKIQACLDSACIYASQAKASGLLRSG